MPYSCEGQIAFYASTPSYRIVLEVHGWQETGDQLGRLAKQRRWTEMPRLIGDDMLATFAITAAPDELAAAVREPYAGKLDRVTFYLPFEPGQDDAFWRNAIRSFRL